MWNKTIQQLANKEENKGILPSIIFPYPVTYIDNDDCEICADCANSDKGESIWNVTDYFIDETDNICASCGKHIDPALNTQERA